MDTLLAVLTDHVMKHNSLKGAESIVNDFDLTELDLKPYFVFDDSHYTRNPVCKNEHILITILCWQPNQGSPIHNHPKQGCLMKILQGSLEEQRFDTDTLEPRSTTTHKLSSVGYIDDTVAYHIIKNTGSEPAISLHCYSPSTYNIKVYNEL